MPRGYIQQHFATSSAPYPLIVHLHAAAFVGWLLLLTTLYISDAGFARWLSVPIGTALGQGFWPQMAAQYLPNDLVAMSIGAYDIITRGCVLPAYAAGIAWTAALQLLAVALLFSAWWPPIANHLLGR